MTQQASVSQGNTRSPEYERLEAFIGEWLLEGRQLDGPFGPPAQVSARQSFEWLPGGLFLIMRFDGRVGQTPAACIEVTGHHAVTGTIRLTPSITTARLRNGNCVSTRARGCAAARGSRAARRLACAVRRCSATTAMSWPHAGNTRSTVRPGRRSGTSKPRGSPSSPGAPRGARRLCGRRLQGRAETPCGCRQPTTMGGTSSAGAIPSVSALITGQRQCRMHDAHFAIVERTGGFRDREL
ncbi:MAG: DUF1579 domain-containing protein, partial [Gammaproteobacteria bacterium]|nr:DUF1579 domain-containing protein [Gammaproteobacteria bacterium]